MSFDTLILAAGRSRRMGQPKALLEVDGEPLLARILRVATRATPGRVGLICGQENISGTLCPAAAQSLIEKLGHPVVIIEGQSQKQPIDSIRCGLQKLGVNGRLLLWPVDMAFGSETLIEALAKSFAPSADNIARPCIEGKHGHPVLFGTQAQRELLSPLADHGAHHVVRNKPERIIDIPWHDARVTRAMNTPAQALGLGLSI